MFRHSSNRFKTAYFVSSFLPSYTLLLVILTVQHFELGGNLLLFTTEITVLNVIFFLNLIIFFLSVCCLLYVKSALNNILKNSKSRNPRTAHITQNYNVGMREFLLSVLVPVLTTISIQDMPITGFVTMLILQLLIYFYYLYSSEYFPNLSLQLINYSVINAEDKEYNRDIYLFAKSKIVNDIINCDHNFVYFGKVNKNSCIGIIVGG